MQTTSAATAMAGRSKSEILRKVQEMLQQILALESPASIRPEARLRDDLNVDSVGMVDVVIGVEETFGVKLGSDINLLERIVTVGDAVDLIAELSEVQRT
jgi:acyl carrier protein